MDLTCIGPRKPGFDLRSFECPTCNHNGKYRRQNRLGCVRWHLIIFPGLTFNIRQHPTSATFREARLRFLALLASCHWTASRPRCAIRRPVAMSDGLTTLHLQCRLHPQLGHVDQVLLGFGVKRLFSPAHTRAGKFQVLVGRQLLRHEGTRRQLADDSQYSRCGRPSRIATHDGALRLRESERFPCLETTSADRRRLALIDRCYEP
jgi:hypothetical protein